MDCDKSVKHQVNIAIILFNTTVIHVAPHPISNCLWRFTYIKILKYKYTPEEKHINILVTYINNKKNQYKIITRIIEDE